MNCYYHPDREAVVTCKKCGRPMCRDCESKALYKTNNTAYCIRCSIETVCTSIRNSKYELFRRGILLIILSPVVLFGLILLIVGIVNGDYFGEVLFAAFLFLAVGFLLGLVAKRGKQDITSADVYKEVNRAVNPVSSLLFSALGYAIAGPFLFTAEVIQYFKDKKELEKLIHLHEMGVNEDLKRESTSSEFFIQEINNQLEIEKKKDSETTLKIKKQKKGYIIFFSTLCGIPVLFALIGLIRMLLERLF